MRQNEVLVAMVIRALNNGVGKILILRKYIILGCAAVVLSCMAVMAFAQEALVASPVKDSLSVNDRRRFDYFYIEAVSQQVMGNYAEAFELLRHAGHINPRAAEVYYSQSLYYSSMGQDSLALASILKASQLSPGNSTYLERVAEYYIGVKDYPKAIDAYERLYERNHDNTDVLRTLLQLYQANNQYDEMLHTLDRIETQEGESEQLTLSKMRIYEMKDDKKSAYEVLKSLVEKHPNDFLYRTMLGNWLMQNGKQKEAYKYFTGVLKEDPDNASALASLYDYYVEVGEVELARQLMERILTSEKMDSDTKLTLLRQYISQKGVDNADSVEVLHLFDLALSVPQQNADIASMRAGYMYLKKMQPDSVDNAFRKVLDIAPDNAPARLHIVQSLLQKKDYDGVIAMCLPAQEYNPDEMAFYYFAGWAYYQKDEKDSTLQTFRKGVAQINSDTNPDLASDMYAIMGDILYQKSEHDEAYAAYENSLKYKSDNLSTLNNYAYYLSLEGRDLQKAEQMSYKTIKAEPKNATFLDTYAWLLFVQERYAEAKIYVEQALQNVDSTDLSAAIYDHVGDIYYKNGMVDEAVTYWKKAFTQDPTMLVAKWKMNNKQYITEQEYNKRWKKE